MAMVQKSPGVRTGGGPLVLPNPVQPGGVVIIFYSGSSGGPQVPAGFTAGPSAQNATQYAVLYTYTSVSGGETTFPVSGGDNGQWVAYEFDRAYDAATVFQQQGQFNPPLSVNTATAAPGSTLLFSVEQDSGSLITLGAGAGYTVDYLSPGSNGNHQGAIGTITATSGTVSINPTMDGSTSLATVFEIPAPATPKVIVSEQSAMVQMVQKGDVVSEQSAMVMMRNPGETVSDQSAMVAMRQPGETVSDQSAYVLMLPPLAPTFVRRRSYFVM